MLLTHFASIPQENIAERQKIVNLIGKVLQAQLKQPDATVPVERDLPPTISKALSEKNGADLVSLIRARDLSVLSVETKKAEIIEVITAYAKPIPSSNATANKEAYEALAILDRSNSAYKEKAERYAVAERDEKLGALRKLKKRTDSFSGVTYYTHPAQPRYADTRSYFLPYIAEHNGGVTLRVQLHYTNDSWLFVQSAKFNVDGKIMPFSTYSATWKRDNDSEIWEWVDVVATYEVRHLLEQVANSKKTIVRFDGHQYYDDFTVSDKDKIAIRQVLAAEKALRETNQ